MEQTKSVIYASNRMDVPELLKVRDLLVAKYTKTILPDREIGVYPRLVLKLSMSYPERELCEKYLEAIADNFGVEWSADNSSEEEEEVDEKANSQESVEKAEEDAKLEMLRSLSPSSSHGNSGSPLPSISPLSSSHESLPPPPSYSDVKSSSAPLPMDYSKQSQHQHQNQHQQQQQSKQNLPDFDEFTRRFEALRKK